MSTTNSSSSGGVGFCGLLTIVFITLKLLGVIDWSWWLVWSPILIGAGIVAFFLAVMIILAYRR